MIKFSIDKNVEDFRKFSLINKKNNININDIFIWVFGADLEFRNDQH